jgi:hypothetical protein
VIDVGVRAQDEAGAHESSNTCVRAQDEAGAHEAVCVVYEYPDK